MDKKTDIDTNDKTETNTISNENNTDNTLDLPDTPEWISRKWQEEHSSEKNSSAPKKKYVKKKNYNRLIALIIILVALIGGLIYYLYTNNNEDAAPTVTTQQSNAINIMIMGVDRRADDVGRSDKIMVLTYNPADKKASLLSLPRDTRVHIEKNDYDKINHAYAYGGHELNKKTVEAFLNVPVDYYVMIKKQLNLVSII